MILCFQNQFYVSRIFPHIQSKLASLSDLKCQLGLNMRENPNADRELFHLEPIQEEQSVPEAETME